MLFIFGGISIALLGIIIRLLPYPPLDPLLIRGSFILICFATYFLTLKSNWVINNLSRIVLVEVLLFVMWLAYLIALNNLDAFTGAVSIFSLIGISLFFPTPRILLIFLFLYLGFLTPIILTVEDPIINPYIFIALLISSGFLGYLILFFISLIQKQLNQSNNDFRILVDSIQDAIFLVSKNYRIIKVNKKGVDVLTNFFSRSVKEGDLVLDFIYNEEQNLFKQNFERAFKGETVVVQNKLFSIHDKAKWFEFRYIPVHGDDQNVKAVLFSAFDITTQKASSEIIERSEERFRTVFEAAPVGMSILNLKGKVSNVNSSFTHTLGYTEETALDRSFVDIIHPDDKKEIEFFLKKLKASDHEEFQGEMKLLKDDGNFIHSITRVARINNPGKNDFLLAQIVDISQLKESEDKLRDKNLELEKANAELDKFVYSAAHDLRAPLTSVLGLINLVKSENGSDLNKYIDLIEKSIIKLDYFIKDVIDYSRNSRSGLSTKEIDIKELVNKTFEYHNFIESTVKITHQVSVSGNANFLSDPGRLEIILNNLISNAIKYHDKDKENPFIHVDARISKNGLDLEITDNGIGIPRENLDKIFNIFYRGHELSKGSGLGLYIVKETVEKLNGIIQVDSELGKGTRFRIKIPNMVLEEA